MQDLKRRMRPSEFVQQFMHLGGKPFSIKEFPYLPAIYDSNAREMGLFTGRQVSKCGWVGTRVVLANGTTKAFGDLVVGDVLQSVDDHNRACLVTVTRVFPREVKPCVRVKHRAGAEVILTAEHRLRVLQGYRAVGDLRIGDRLASIRRYHPIPVTGAATAGEAESLGYMIGDGCCDTAGAMGWSFTTADPECLAELQRLADGQCVVSTKAATHAKALRLHRSSPVVAHCVAGGLHGKYSWEKRIPSAIFGWGACDVGVFLSRLWATDGTIRATGVTYSTTSVGLAFDVQSLLRKFGVLAWVSRRAAGYRDPAGDYVACRDCYVVRLIGQDSIQAFETLVGRVPGKPFVALATAARNNRLTAPLELNDTIAELNEPFCRLRKVRTLMDVGLRATPKYALSIDKLSQYQEFFRSKGCTGAAMDRLEGALHRDAWWDVVEALEPAGDLETVDVEVTGPACFVLEGGIVSHNSTYLASSMTAVAATTPHGIQVLVTPLQDQAFVFSTQRLTDFLERSPVIREGYFTGPDIINQTLKKRLTNNHLISLGYAQRTADRLRGQSVKTRLNYDEIQDIFPEVIPVINELAFRYPDCRFLYSGTPKSRQNHMEAMRARSTDAEWAVKCREMGCGHWNHAWDETNIGPTGVVCAKCRRPLNTNLGQWVARRRYGSVINNVKILMETYRISQLIVKPIMDHPVKWDELLTKLRSYPNAQFRNEVLGLPADIGTQPITREKLVACCDTNRPNEIPDRSNPRLPRLVMGVDWAVNGGANAGNSLTAVVIGGWDPFPSRFQIYFSKVFRGAEAGPDYEIDWIKRHFVSSGARLIGADWGSGHVQNLQLINALGEMHVAQLFHTGMGGGGMGGTKAPRAKWDPRTRKYHLARTRVLTDTFETARMRQLTLPRAEESEDLIQHFLAEALEYNERSNTQRYVNAEPDDLLHAVTYAMIGGELLERGDFMGNLASTSDVLPGSEGDAWNENPDAIVDSLYQ